MMFPTEARMLAIGCAVLLASTSVSSAGKRHRLQQPVVPASQLQCYTADCLSLSTTVRLSDACFRTCAAHCGGRFQACVGGSWLNDCRPEGDRCDLSCQKQCRAYGGPLLHLTD
jgi:hypothetical protein